MIIAWAATVVGVASPSAFAQAPPGYEMLPNRAAQVSSPTTRSAASSRSVLAGRSRRDAELASHADSRLAAAAEPAGLQPMPPPVAADRADSPATAASGTTAGRAIVVDCGDWCGDASSAGWLGDRLWARGEYLMWWNRDADLPALVTTSPVNTPRAQSGVLGQPNTTILYGDDDVTNGMHSGGRFTVGAWSDACQDVGFEAVYLFLNRSESIFAADGQATPILARPFFNVTTDQQDAVLVAYPGQTTGTLSVRDGTRLWSGELLMRRALVREKTRELDWLLGYRYARMDEDLTFDQSVTVTNPVGAIPVGTTFTAFDRFAARNDFHGAELGAESRAYRGAWTINLAAKVALGDTRSRVAISGDSVVAVPNNLPVASAGGVLAQPTNIGQFHRNMFTILPQFDVRLDCHLTCNLSLTCGYTLLYWSRLARPQDQIDANLNPSQFSGGQLTGVAAPVHRFTSIDYWAQGLSFGVDYQF